MLNVCLQTKWSFGLVWLMVEPPTKFSKRGTLIGPPFLEGVAGKEEGDFFRGMGGGGFFNKK